MIWFVNVNYSSRTLPTGVYPMVSMPGKWIVKPFLSLQCLSLLIFWTSWLPWDLSSQIGLKKSHELCSCSCLYFFLVVFRVTAMLCPALYISLSGNWSLHNFFPHNYLFESESKSDLYNMKLKFMSLKSLLIYIFFLFFCLSVFPC